MSASKRLQVNIKMSDDILLYDNFTAIYMPIAWIEEVEFSMNFLYIFIYFY